MTTLKSNLLKKGKKGFTLTELAIVIAVIAILIAVLVPTFTSVITNARKTAALSNAKNTITEYTIANQSYPKDGAVIVDGSDYYVIYDSSADDLYTTVETDKYDGDIIITQSNCIYEGEVGKIYGEDESNTSIAQAAKDKVKDKIAEAIGNYTKVSTLVSDYSLYVTDNTYWWKVESITATANAASGSKIKVANTAVATEETTTYTYTATLTEVDTSAKGWVTPDSNSGYTPVALTIDSGSCYMYTCDITAVVEAGMDTITSATAGTYYVKATDPNGNVYYYSTVTAASEGEENGTWSSTTALTNSTAYGDTSTGTSVTSITGYTNWTISYKAEDDVAKEAALAVATTEEVETSNTYYVKVTVGTGDNAASTYYTLSYTAGEDGSDGSWSVELISENGSNTYSNESNTEQTATTSYYGFSVSYKVKTEAASGGEEGGSGGS